MRQYRMPASGMVSFLPLPKPELRLEHKSLYSLYRKVGRSYIRVSTMSYPEKTAYIVFGQQLGLNLDLSLREITIECNEAK